MEGDETRYLQNYGRTNYIRMIREALQDPKYEGLPEDTIMRLVSLESTFDPKAKSKAGYQGLMQVSQNEVKTMQKMGRLPKGKYDLYKPYDNIQTGLAYYKRLLDVLGEEDAALQAYRKGLTTYLRGDRAPEYLEGIRRQKKVW